MGLDHITSLAGPTKTEEASYAARCLHTQQTYYPIPNTTQFDTLVCITVLDVNIHNYRTDLKHA